MKWTLFILLVLAVIAGGIAIYLAYLIFSIFGDLYGPWTKR